MFKVLPSFRRRLVYSPGRRSGSSTKNNAIIPDLWCHSFSDLMQNKAPFLVGDIKLHWKWNSSLRQSTDNDSKICYLNVLAQINFYMVVGSCVSAIILTEKEAVVVERVAGWKGWLRVSRPFTGPRDMSIALLGLCLRVCSTETSYTESGELREASPDAYYPREETEPPSSSSKANPSTTSYS